MSYHSLTLTLYLTLHTGHDDMVVKQVTVHGLASQPNQPDAIRQALREFEDDLHTGPDGNPLKVCFTFFSVFIDPAFPFEAWHKGREEHGITMT